MWWTQSNGLRRKTVDSSTTVIYNTRLYTTNSNTTEYERVLRFNIQTVQETMSDELQSSIVEGKEC